MPGARTVATAGFALPGLVDAHCHIGIRRGPKAIESVDEARALARTDRDAGVLAIRDAGSPYPYPELVGEDGMPRLIRAGHHIAASRRYLRGIGLECEPHEAVAALARQAALGDGWVKLVGDWIDRDKGDLAPSFEPEILTAAIHAAQAEGAKVAVHTFSEEAVACVVEAGADSIEHGTGLAPDLLDRMAARGIALVPTMINIETFDDIAAGADAKFPRYADHMRRLKQGFPDVVRAAWEGACPSTSAPTRAAASTTASPPRRCTCSTSGRASRPPTSSPPRPGAPANGSASRRTWATSSSTRTTRAPISRPSGSPRSSSCAADF